MGDRQPRLDFFRIGERIGSEIVRARKAHPDRGWVMGNCVVCGGMIAHPTVPHDRWAFSEACAVKAPDWAEPSPSRPAPAHCWRPMPGAA